MRLLSFMRVFIRVRFALRMPQSGSTRPPVRLSSPRFSLRDKRWLPIALVAMTLAISACGFKLRQPAELPFASLYVQVPATSVLGGQLRRQVAATTNSRVVDDPAQAEASLELLGESREKVVLSLNAQGRAREYELRQRISFRVVGKNGSELIGPTELALKRVISFNDSDVLAKESEETLLYNDMQTDIVQQLIRRIAAVKPPL